MRILWLKSDLLLPLDKGGRLRTWHLLRHLARRHEITYLSFAEGERDGMNRVAQRLETVPRIDSTKGTAAFYAHAALHLVDPFPYAVGRYRSRAFRRRLARLLDEIRFDLIVSDFLVPVVNLPRRLPCPSVLFTHNVESEIWRRHAETRSGLPGLLYRSQHARMLRFERRALGRFDAVLTVSHTDRDTFARLFPDVIKRPVHVVSTGVDTEYFTASPSPPAGRHLVFTGSMDWLPNEDAMTYFVREILPRIRADEPATTLTIVGRAPTPAVRRLAADHGVVVTGRVDDVRPHVREGTIYIVPLRIGGGTRLKIFEAMAMGKAVVSTTVGAEGLAVASGEHVAIADDPQSFAKAVVRLFRDVTRRRALEAAARKLVVDRFDWSAVAVELEDALIEVARQPTARWIQKEILAEMSCSASERARA
jgi:sugar transferase (PEP-CTERM/EpsH1 system associated)